MKTEWIMNLDNERIAQKLLNLDQQINVKHKHKPREPKHVAVEQIQVLILMIHPQ